MAVPQTVPVHRLTLDDVLAMVDAGTLDESARVELEGGVLVEMVPPGKVTVTAWSGSTVISSRARVTMSAYGSRTRS